MGDVIGDTGAVGMCRFDAAPADGASCITRHHDGLAVDAGIPSMAAFRTGQDASVVEVSGEIDASNVDALARVVSARRAAGRPVELDLGGLTFGDREERPPAVRRLATLAGIEALSHSEMGA
jgi:hypothetical protein